MSRMSLFTIMILASLMSSSIFANQPMTSYTQGLVRAKLWHEGIELKTSISSKDEFDSVTSYPEELTVAIDLLNREKR